MGKQNNFMEHGKQIISHLESADWRIIKKLMINKIFKSSFVIAFIASFGKPSTWKPWRSTVVLSIVLSNISWLCFFILIISEFNLHFKILFLYFWTEFIWVYFAYT